MPSQENTKSGEKFLMSVGEGDSLKNLVVVNKNFRIDRLSDAFNRIAVGEALDFFGVSADSKRVWRIGYAALQNAALKANFQSAQRLAAVLLRHFPARAAKIEACMANIAPMVPQENIAPASPAAATSQTVPEFLKLANLTDADLAAEAVEHLREIIARVVTQVAIMPPEVERPRLDSAAFRLARRVDLREELAMLWPVLLGLDGTPASAALAFQSGVRVPELILHLADLFEINSIEGEKIEEFASLLDEAAASDLLKSLQSRGLTDAARLAMRALIGTPAMPPSAMVRLVQLEQNTQSGLDPLSILDVGVLLFPRNSFLRVERGKLLMRHGAMADAVADARIALDDPSASVPILLGAADLLVAGGQTAEAAGRLGQKLPLHPDSEVLLMRAAQFYAWASNHVEALRLARSALHLDVGKKPGVQLLVARLLIGSGQDAEALTLLETAMEEEGADDIAVSFVEVAIRTVWRSMPDYVDWVLVERLQRAMFGVAALIDINRLWEGVRLYAKLERGDTARHLCALALARQEKNSQAIGQELAILLRELCTFGGAVGDLTSVTPTELGITLLREGVALTATGRQLGAQLCFQIGAGFAPAEPAIRFNAGFGAIAAGAIEEAYRQFDGMSRIYENDMSRVAWPWIGNLPWPHAPFQHGDSFAELKPKDQDWPLITVVTPSYNQASYIEETILSVLRQGYPRLQYIIVDGQSTDGSCDIIERYRDVVDTVIIEKDRGQTEAINKGLRLARGEIVTWLNSDDMFGPGALHAIALKWLQSRADLVFGFCLPHKENGFVMANLPKARADTFTVQCLGDIFKYWMKGFFFYQPEVFFSRRILDLVGGELREDLYYTMDYDFWLRCAQAGATVEPLGWPIALFRQHREQKTANLLDCMLEQAEVRDTFVNPEPVEDRRVEVRRRLQVALGSGARPNIGVISSRISKIFSPDVAPDLEQALAAKGFNLAFADSAASLPQKPDILIKLVHLQNDVAEINAMRGGGFDGPIVGWFWDNHHHLFANFDVAERLDIIVPGHHFARHYLSNRDAIGGPSLPLCITQWSEREARGFWAEYEDCPRSDALYGGFVRYAFASKRNTLIEKLIGAGFDGVYFLPEGYLQRYFGLSLRERFREWASHKASIIVPLAGDLSQRLFDSLLAGQVPIVPRDVMDLDSVVSPELQKMLPIIRFDKYDVDSVRDAYAEAIAAFDGGGTAGARARHLFALEGHTFNARILTLLEQLQDLTRRL